MKLVLIAPSWADPLWKKEKTKGIFPPLNLAIVAGLTPEDWEIRIVDENLEDVDTSLDADLVGITAMTSLAPRAYQIADAFRARGVKVVLGGIHSTALPEEAIQHADAVVIGEAEATWPQVVKDFLAGGLQPFYRAAQYPSLDSLSPARRQLLNHERYLLPSTVYTTRGCPFACSFCSVTTFFGHTYRFRPVMEVVKEIGTLPNKLVAFVDDNIIGNLRYARNLFQALVQQKITWFSQGSINIAKHPDLLDLARESGCIGLFIGFESLSPTTLKEMHKKQNQVEEYEEAITTIHRHGLSVEGAFVFGFDEDDEAVFERTVDFARRNKMEAAQFAILTPYPGTPLYTEMEQQGRIIDDNWAHYDVSHVVFEPRGMSAKTLQEGRNWAWKEFYSLSSIASRLGLFHRYGPGLWALNWQIRKRVRNPAI
ncbi:MAG: B12-binding domain-containing radical SAM protein [Clostridia bacterium]|nr:MAG: B12-binding domain-containing radical SAM protein [Clostridia bacterium]